NEQLVTAAREHAGEWEQFAQTLEALMANGWALQNHVGVIATRSIDADALPPLLDEALAERTLAQWCVVDDDQRLCPVGGLVAHRERPAETFPGAPLPALVANELTGGQRIVASGEELRAVVCEELAACAAWWRSHPQEMSDHAAHEFPDELDELAAA